MRYAKESELRRCYPENRMGRCVHVKQASLHRHGVLPPKPYPAPCKGLSKKDPQGRVRQTGHVSERSSHEAEKRFRVPADPSRAVGGIQRGYGASHSTRKWGRDEPTGRDRGRTLTASRLKCYTRAIPTEDLCTGGNILLPTREAFLSVLLREKCIGSQAVATISLRRYATHVTRR